MPRTRRPKVKREPVDDDEPSSSATPLTSEELDTVKAEFDKGIALKREKLKERYEEEVAALYRQLEVVTSQIPPEILQMKYSDLKAAADLSSEPEPGPSNMKQFRPPVASTAVKFMGPPKAPPPTNRRTRSSSLTEVDALPNFHRRTRSSSVDAGSTFTFDYTFKTPANKMMSLNKSMITPKVDVRGPVPVRRFPLQNEIGLSIRGSPLQVSGAPPSEASITVPLQDGTVYSISSTPAEIPNVPLVQSTREQLMQLRVHLNQLLGNIV